MAFLFLGILYCLLQFLLTGWFLFLLTTYKKIPRIQFTSKFAVFFLPGFFFYGRNVHFNLEDAPEKDSMHFKAGTVFFWLNPFALLLGKIRIHKLYLNQFHIFYLNKIPSHKKLHLIPTFQKIKLYGNLNKGSFDLEDRSRFPIYRLSLREIMMEDFELDLGFQIGLFFFAKKGQCKIGSGSLHTHLLSKNHGILRISGVTIGEFINLEGIPLFQNQVELATEFKHSEGSTDYRGVIGQNFLPEEAEQNPDLPKKRKVGFQFSMQWIDYKLPLDLGVKQLLSQMAGGTSIGGVVSETLGVLKSFLGGLLKPIPTKEEQVVPIEDTKLEEKEMKSDVVQAGTEEIN